MKCKNKNCGIKFTPTMAGQRTHDYKCAIELARQEREKKKLKEDRQVKNEIRDRLKSRSDWLKEAQAVFNKFIRLRDEKELCISCGRNNNVKWNAGHFRSVGSCPELRFNEDNCHRQCEHCNSYLSGNIGEYRRRLIQKIGIEKVEWLEGPHEAKKYSIPEILEIKERYKNKVKELCENQEAHDIRPQAQTAP